MNIAIILAAGSSSRAGQNKLWADVYGKPLWTLSAETFYKHPKIDRVVIVTPRGESFRFTKAIESWGWDIGYSDQKMAIIDDGGDTRMRSFKNGVDYIIIDDLERNLTSEDIIIDHNAANPNVTAEEITAVIEAAKLHGAAAVAHPVVDTVIQIMAGEDFATNSWNRDNLRLMQTPQSVRGNVIQNLFSHKVLRDTTDLTTALVEHIPVKILPANPKNKKITYAEDLAALTAQTFLGEDSHRFSSGGQLVLGGLTIAELPALEANSDGDVILHAIGRALAQACGENFSEVADPLMLSGDSNSRDYIDPFLEEVKIQQVSLSLECARPKIDPIEPALKKSLSEILKVDESQIHLSAHTGEGLTPFGLGEGIRCLAIVRAIPLK